MALKKLQFKPGINKEITRYASEGGWHDCDKVRFRQGFPEKIGGWRRLSNSFFQGTCRSLFTWSSLAGIVHRAVGTHLKMYIEIGGIYYDATPIRNTTSAGEATFSSTTGSSIITVTDAIHGAKVDDFVTFSNAITLGTSTITDAVLNQEHQVVNVIDGDTYTIDVSVVSDETVSGGGGALTVAEYQINTGEEITRSVSGWSAGPFGSGAWGQTVDPEQLQGARVWSFGNFGEDLIAANRGSEMYYWDLSGGAGTRAVRVADLAGASEVPLQQTLTFVSDINRFVFALGTNDALSTDIDPMLVRWSDQESVVNWLPAATNQAGSLRLSRGSEIKAVNQARQEILVWTDTSLYSLQYLGAPIVWGSQLVGDNITVASQNATAEADGKVFWMGVDQFYVYAGQVQTLPSTLKKYVFNDINLDQLDQVFGGTNDRFNEIWWFYPSKDSSQIDRYVVYNYVEQLWYHGNLARTAWESQQTVIAATYSNNLVQHEVGYDDAETANVLPITSYIVSSDMDLEDGDRFSFIWRVLPDITFENSEIGNPSADMTIYGLKNSGSGYFSPNSVGGVNSKAVSKVASTTVEAFTEQVNIRLRARQIVFKIQSDDNGVAWQLGAPRMDIRTDGKR